MQLHQAIDQIVLEDMRPFTKILMHSFFSFRWNDYDKSCGKCVTLPQVQFYVKLFWDSHRLDGKEQAAQDFKKKSENFEHDIRHFM